MNLIQFLNKVDEMADYGSKDELLSFIHETARLLEEESREEFIVRLEKAVAGQLLGGIRKGSGGCVWRRTGRGGTGGISSDQ